MYDRGKALSPPLGRHLRAGWVNLFTLHARWPFLWIWAVTYRPDRGWGFAPQPSTAGAGPAAGAGPTANPSELEDLRRRIAQGRNGRPIMELLLILIYVSICYAVHKVFKMSFPKFPSGLGVASSGGIIA